MAPAGPSRGRITLILGGARSGKSAVASELAARCGEPVTFVATGVATDEDMAARIARHQAARPAGWRTVEADDAGNGLAGTVAALPGTVLVDSLGAWVARAEGFAVDAGNLCEALGTRAGDTVVVSDEVGLGVHPSTEAGREFRDALGEVNQAVAAVADEVLLVVAGRALRLEPLA